MVAIKDLLKELHRAMGRDPRVELRHIKLDLGQKGTVTLEGEVPDIATKRLALRGAAGLPEVPGIVDRLHVRAAQAMSDAVVRDHVRDAIVQDDGLLAYEGRVRSGDHVDAIRGAPPDASGFIEIEVDDGIVTLNGSVTSLAAKRLAGVLAWWVPGSRDVINGLAVEPPEEDSDDAVVNAVRDVLERDHVVDHEHVHVGAHDGVVTLAGILPSEEQKHIAESDAWYVFGVDDVVNRIEVHPY